MALLFVLFDDPHNVIAEFRGGDLVAPKFPTPVQPEGAAEMHLEAFLTPDDLALEPNVRDLGAGAGVGATIEGDFQGNIQVVQPLL